MTQTETKPITQPALAFKIEQPTYKATRRASVGVGIEKDVAGTYGAFLYEKALTEQGIDPDTDGRAEWQRIGAALNATFDAGESEQAARAAEGRATATQAAIDQQTAALKDALARTEAALRAGESTDELDMLRAEAEAELKKLGGRLPIQADEAKRLRTVADAERKQLFRATAMEIHRQAEIELATFRRAATQALLPLFAKTSFWQSLDSVAFQAT